jgi:peptide methionine sulfoxide reductase msrA/msrB
MRSINTTLRAAITAAVIGTLGLAPLWAVDPQQAPDSPPAASSARHAASTKAKQRTVRVHVFDASGKLVGPVESPLVVLSAAEWRKRLTSEQYKVLRSKGTEQAFCGDLVDNHQEGVYACAGCGLPLFASDAKFDSGTGWPSFMRPVAPGNIETHRDLSDGMARTEIHCVRCKGHLGHVFDDGPAPTGLRFCLNSASLTFTLHDELKKLADPAAPGKSGTDTKPVSSQRAADARSEKSSAAASETAVLAGGCFWCMEAVFEQLKGVTDVESGYCGGSAASADYEDVHAGTTRHAEAIRVTYNPDKIRYDQLLDVFFDAHDPTQLNRQGIDVGRQYRSAIFFASESQKKQAEAKIEQLRQQKVYPHRIVTRLEPLAAFYPAEDLHQDFASKNPFDSYIQEHAVPKTCSVRINYPELIDTSK